jgi:hypothetical protein
VHSHAHPEPAKKVHCHQYVSWAHQEGLGQAQKPTCPPDVNPSGQGGSQLQLQSPGWSKQMSNSGCAAAD